MLVLVCFCFYVFVECHHLFKFGFRFFCSFVITSTYVKEVASMCSVAVSVEIELEPVVVKICEATFVSRCFIVSRGREGLGGKVGGHFFGKVTPVPYILHI